MFQNMMINSWEVCALSFIVLVFEMMYKDSKKYAFVSYLRDVKRGRNPRGKYGHFGVHVSLKLFFLDLKNIFRQRVPVVFFQSSAEPSLRLSNVFAFTFPTWNFIDYATTFAGGYHIFSWR